MLATRGARARAISSKKIACSICVAPRAAVLGRPGEAGPAALVELALPRGGTRTKPRRPPARGRGGFGDPAAQLVAELALGGGEREVHQSGAEEEDEDFSGLESEDFLSACLASRLSAPSFAEASVSRLRRAVP